MAEMTTRWTRSRLFSSASDMLARVPLPPRWWRHLVLGGQMAPGARRTWRIRPSVGTGTMPVTSVLIAGASIAGPALASWLHRYGFEVTVVERAAGLRTGGQNVDVRGAGREVARRMGLESAIRAATTGEAGVRFVDADDRTIASFAAGTSDSDGPTAELEILRGDLARLLVEQTDGVEYVFGDHISALDDEG